MSRMSSVCSPTLKATNLQVILVWDGLGAGKGTRGTREKEIACLKEASVCAAKARPVPTQLDGIETAEYVGESESAIGRSV